MDGVLQIELCGQCGQIVRIVVHVVSVRGLRRTAMPATVVGNDAITVVQKEHQLSVPIVG